MKYFIMLALLTGCSQSNYKEPKYKLNQELKVVKGFYSTSTSFTPNSVEHSESCLTGWKYYGDVYYESEAYSQTLVGLGFCEEVLQP